MSRPPARLVILAPRELAGGFALAGVDTVIVDSADEAERSLDGLLAERAGGVVAVYEPFFEALPFERRHRLELSVDPVIVRLPTGLEAEGEESRRARMVERLQRAIGYHIAFGGEES